MRDLAAPVDKSGSVSKDLDLVSACIYFLKSFLLKRSCLQDSDEAKYLLLAN